MSALAEMKRELIIECALAGLAAACAKRTFAITAIYHLDNISSFRVMMTKT